MPGRSPAESPVPFESPKWLQGGHAQTIYPYLLPRPRVRYRRERVATADGDFWDFDWLDDEASQPSETPLVVLFHGLEGGAGSHYARIMMVHLRRIGWRGVVVHFRGCGGEPNALPRAYHSGDHEDVEAMLSHVRKCATPRAPLYALGVSVGGSALLNWVGRAGGDASNMLVAAAAVSVPLDLMASGIAIGQGLNRIYTWHFLKTLKPKARLMARKFPGLLDESRIASARTMRDFDNAVTAPLHGFTNADDYWTRASSKPWLRTIVVPTLVLNARNDPFVPATTLPLAHEVSGAVVLEQPASGGHAGFMTGPPPGRLDWMPRRVISFFTTGR